MYDITCSVPSDCTQIILDHVNTFNRNIQFTIEHENDCSVPFLDTRVIRTQENKIILDWYQKPTASGRFLNYFSNHPQNQKYNTVIAMKNRVTHISDEMFLQNNLKKLFDIFVNNGYPKHILKRLIYNSNIYDGPTEDSNQSEIRFKKLPFIKNITNSITTLFKDFSNIKIAKYNTVKSYNLFSKVKDKTPTLYNNNVVYELPCLNCQGCYVGQTAQWLKQRVTQHKSDCRLGKNTCAVVGHHLKTGHNFDYNNVKILCQENNYKSRLFLEMFHINKNKNAINYKSDTSQLSNIYCNILNLI